jgi:hypothetical protein
MSSRLWRIKIFKQWGSVSIAEFEETDTHLRRSMEYISAEFVCLPSLGRNLERDKNVIVLRSQPIKLDQNASERDFVKPLKNQL